MAGLRGGGDQGPDPDDRLDVPHPRRPGPPGHRRAVDGGRPGDPDRADPPGHVLRRRGVQRGRSQVRRADLLRRRVQGAAAFNKKVRAYCGSGPGPRGGDPQVGRGMHESLEKAGVKKRVREQKGTATSGRPGGRRSTTRPACSTNEAAVLASAGEGRARSVVSLSARGHLQETNRTHRHLRPPHSESRHPPLGYPITCCPL